MCNDGSQQVNIEGVICVYWRASSIHLECPINEKRYSGPSRFTVFLLFRERTRDSLDRGTWLRVNICKWGLNNFRLLLCILSSCAEVDGEGVRAKWSRFRLSRKIQLQWDERRDESERNSKAKQINLIIKKNPHKMDWSLKMPFVLSLFLSFYAASTLRLSYLFFLARCCVVFLLFFLRFSCLCYSKKGRRRPAKFIFALDTEHDRLNEDWSRAKDK